LARGFGNGPGWSIRFDGVVVVLEDDELSRGWVCGGGLFRISWSRQPARLQECRCSRRRLSEATREPAKKEAHGAKKGVDVGIRREYKGNTMPETRRQERSVRFRCSDRFYADIEEAMKKANAPSMSEFIKATLIREGERLGVKVRR
jgi:hypothetical protein